MTYPGAVLLVGRVSLLAQVRRTLTSVLLVLLPLALFAAMRTSGRSLGVAALAVGLSWSLAILASFSVGSNAGLDARLALGGLRPGRIFLGRLAALMVIAVVVSALLAFSVPLIDAGLPPRVMLVGLLMSAAVAISVGMLIGLVMPGELESVLVIIGVFGVPLGLALDSPALKLAPGYGPILYLQYLGERTYPSYFVHTAAISVAALVVSYVWWLQRTHRATALR